jgi:ankyrin repeat protein
MFKEFTKYFNSKSNKVSRADMTISGLPETNRTSIDPKSKDPDPSKPTYRTGKPVKPLKKLTIKDSTPITSKIGSPKKEFPQTSSKNEQVISKITNLPQKGAEKTNFFVNRSLSPKYQFPMPKQTSLKTNQDKSKGLQKTIKGPSNITLQEVSQGSFDQKGPGFDFQSKTDEDFGTRLINAVKSNNFEEVLNLVSNVEANTPNINPRGENDWTPLHFACWVGNIKIVNLLFYNQAEINSLARNGITPLMVSCLKGNVPLIRALLGFQADPTMIDHLGNTILHFSAKSGSAESLKVLLSTNKLDVFAKNFEGKAAIDLIANEQQKSVLLDHMKKLDDYESTKEIKIQLMSNDNFEFADRDSFKGKDNVSGKEPMEDLSEPIGPKSFLIHGLLGKGSFGEVFLVQLKKTGMLYAMKVLDKDKIASN